MTNFFHSVWNEKKKMVCFELSVSSVLTENGDIWNFHSSLTLNNGKLIGYSGSLWYAIVSNMTQFYHNAFNILLANFLPAEYSDEYPAGWYLVFARKANPRTYLATP